MTPLQVGDYVLLLYNGYPDVYHKRLLIGWVDGGTFIVVTPTFDVYAEDVSGNNGDLDDVRVCIGNARPPGLANVVIFDFNPVLSPAQITRLTEEGERLASVERARLELPDPPPRPVAAAAPPPGPAAGAQGGCYVNKAKQILNHARIT